MDRLIEQFYRSNEWAVETHTAQLVRACQGSENYDVLTLARRLAETHDDMQRFHDALIAIQLAIGRADL